MTGGAPTTQAGYGPNTRTMMMIKVAPADCTYRYNPENTGYIEG